MNHHPPGTAPVKAEYVISVGVLPTPDDDAAEGSTKSVPTNLREDVRDHRSNGPSRNKWTKEQKKERRGANKGRRFGKVRDDLDLCWKIAKGCTCEFGPEDCRFTHDIPAYLAAKPKDIQYDPTLKLINEPPFLEHVAPTNEGVLFVDYPTLGITKCPVYEELGECRYGLKCRFLGGHVRRDDDGGLVLTEDSDKRALSAITATEVNYASPDLLKALRSKKYPHPIADIYLKELQEMDHGVKKPADGEDNAESDMKVETEATGLTEIIVQRTGDDVIDDSASDARTRFSEKKRLNWTGKSYLAPLTTVGNLPFRRLCVTYGADITCGEMGLATSFLAGSKEEWSLVRRHPSESMFGVQIAGSKASTMVPTAEVIGRECAGNIDFVDINCGCPIDLVFRSGSGSALLDAPAKLGKILVGMNRALGEIPVTVKLRTGVKDGRNTAHKVMPRLSAEWGAGCITLHGRTRQQRYTRLADWKYIKQCVEAVRSREADEDAPHVPIFGGGDCYSSQDYWSAVEESGVDGVMIGRGGLIKPWIFTEIKERREWDISSRERLEGIRKYAEYGINHFGSDTAGVNTTRRYLCEALSFQYRYVPIGLLERFPGRINDRAPAYRGRDELETLLASGDSRDWVRISEMFLGPAPESWTFTPKHKSNAYGTEESQG